MNIAGPPPGISAQNFSAGSLTQLLSHEHLGKKCFAIRRHFFFLRLFFLKSCIADAKTDQARLAK